MNTIWIVLPILTLLMFDLGLTLRLEDFSKVFRHPGPVWIALVGQLVLLPAIALGLCVTALILVAIGCSSLLSRLVKNDARQRRTVVIEVGMQNAAQAIAIASSPFIFASEEMAIPAILYSLMMNVVLFSYVGIIRAREKKAYSSYSR